MYETGRNKSECNEISDVTYTKDHIQRKICLLTVHCETI
ncbi:hypothetical protein AC80_2157 [Escherichia coli 1-110-08_S4_C1]|nr:hypothetical protein AC80_2157 [Escherichia coli 1-110-08_S4_C1]